ncbi:MAG: hypothetical protein H0V74_01765 [Chloroflexi bacterium]|nr:hypothetical protein [Chloroflexota bacterium]
MSAIASTAHSNIDRSRVGAFGARRERHTVRSSGSPRIDGIEVEHNRDLPLDLGEPA